VCLSVNVSYLTIISLSLLDVRDFSDEGITVTMSRKHRIEKAVYKPAK